MTKSTGVGRGAGGGQPTKYRPGHIKAARALAKLGATEWEIAQYFEVSVVTLRQWCHTHPTFLAAIKPGRRAGDDRIELSLYRRGTGYSYDSEEIVPYDHIEETEETIPPPPERPDEKPRVIKKTVKTKKVMRVPIVRHVPPDPTSMIFWLKNRRKDKWRNYKQVELSTAPGKPLEVAATSLPAEAELIGAYHERLAKIAAGRNPNPRLAGRVVENGRPGEGPEGDPGAGEE